MEGMDDPELIAGVNRWVGVVIAVVGSLVVSPSASSKLWRSTVLSVKQGGRRVQSGLAWAFPRLFPTRRVVSDVKIGTGAVAATSTMMAAAGHQWSPGASLEVRLEQLRQHLLAVEHRLGEAQQQLRREVADRATAVAQVLQSLTTEVNALRGHLVHQERQATDFTADGLPVLGVGVLLSGVPEDLARLPTPLAWALPLIGVLIALRAVRLWRRRRRAHAATP